MSTKIFVNLPVKDLSRSMGFFTGLGFTFNPDFTDDKAACMVISDDIYAMLLTEPYFRKFTGKAVTDTATSSEAIVALLLDTRQDVDRIAEAALAGGGRTAEQTNENSPMYTRSFFDLDGHHWEFFHAAGA
ncbi:glyoxalase/bleomycin resistance/extradiol dioxygenase family protein [Streptomyces sp. NBC_00669]|uniref:VOC family protein n=1 Tax=unclassified Streptomyces TaxID=2593676 RepID=UPI002E2EFBAF|nr:VOC family protein [Streptomyces sp. NBC_00669]